MAPISFPTAAAAPPATRLVGAREQRAQHRQPEGGLQAFEEGLPLVGAVHQRRAEHREAGQGIAAGGEAVEPAGGPAAPAQQRLRPHDELGDPGGEVCAIPRLRRIGQLDGLRQAVGMGRGRRAQAAAHQALDHDQHLAAGELPDVAHQRQGGHRQVGGRAVIVGLPAGRQARHRQPAPALVEGCKIADQRAVARLEDAEGRRQAGQQHMVGEREERDLRGDVHVGAAQPRVQNRRFRPLSAATR